MNLTDKISKGRAQIILRDPFFATILMDMDVKIDGARTENCATDGDQLYFNPEWLADAKPDLIAAAMRKMALHAALAHPLRRRSREPRKWTTACDQAALHLMRNDDLPLPEGAIANPLFTGMTAEEIYRHLEEQEDNDKDDQGGDQPQAGAGGGQSGDGDQGGDKQGGDAPVAGHSLDSSAKDAAEVSEKERQNDQRTMRAQMAAKAAGKTTKNSDMLADQIRQNNVNWRDRLLDFVDSRVDVEISWSKFNRRYLPHDIYLPGAIPDGLTTLGVVLDSSGSIFADKKTLNAFFGQLEAVREAVGIEKVVIVHCDTKVKRVDTFEDGDPIPAKTYGGGGTNMAPAMREVAKHHPQVVICLTDGEFYEELTDDPQAPTLFCVYGGRSDAPASFGESIKIPPAA